MGSIHRLTCELCGGPLEYSGRMRILAQRESSRAKWTECGWALYAHPECCEALLDVIRRLKREKVD